MPCVSKGECREKGLAVPEGPKENRFEPIPEDDGTLRSDEPSGRFRTLFGMALAWFADDSADELDLVASDDEPPAVGR